MRVFIMQTGEQDAPIGQHLDFAGGGFEAWSKGIDHAAVVAEGQVG